MNGRALARAAKRGLDLAIAAPALVVLSPVLALVALVVRAALGAPVLFRQRRPGLHGVPFTLVKFRTMAEAPPGSESEEAGDASRLTRVGAVLRALSLDELPALWNVVRGEMSLVGPRPLLMQYLDRYTPEQARRHEVKPGVTGWAQVNGRNALTWEEKFRLDVWYVDHQTFWLDLEVLAMTAWRVATMAGISARGHATMPEFRGSAKR